MRAAGMFLLFAGFALVPGALLLLGAGAPRNAFVLAGVAIQIGGLALSFRAHYTLDEGGER